jgi:hypothetical protein
MGATPFSTVSTHFDSRRLWIAATQMLFPTEIS